MLQLTATLTLLAVSFPLAAHARSRRREPIAPPPAPDEYERLESASAAARSAADELDRALDALDERLGRLRSALLVRGGEVARASAA